MEAQRVEIKFIEAPSVADILSKSKYQWNTEDVEDGIKFTTFIDGWNVAVPVSHKLIRCGVIDIANLLDEMADIQIKKGLEREASEKLLQQLGNDSSN